MAELPNELLCEIVKAQIPDSLHELTLLLQQRVLSKFWYEHLDPLLSECMEALIFQAFKLFIPPFPCSRTLPRSVYVEFRKKVHTLFQREEITRLLHCYPGKVGGFYLPEGGRGIFLDPPHCLLVSQKGMDGSCHLGFSGRNEVGFVKVATLPGFNWDWSRDPGIWKVRSSLSKVPERFFTQALLLRICLETMVPEFAPWSYRPNKYNPQPLVLNEEAAAFLFMRSRSDFILLRWRGRNYLLDEVRLVFLQGSNRKNKRIQARLLSERRALAVMKELEEHGNSLEREFQGLLVDWKTNHLSQPYYSGVVLECEELTSELGQPFMQLLC